MTTSSSSLGPKLVDTGARLSSLSAFFRSSYLYIKVAQREQLQKIINSDDKNTELKDGGTYIFIHLIFHVLAEAFLFLSADLVLILQLPEVVINPVEEV